uniref:DOMON domain-containing protein n=1 Tax=Branchiostoma floridae TaxID=7739 RepID=C3YVT0_BRAFL|eukprot:XP_002599602.1 hypothetical protein BRAFLDRAFT_77701 [Branchiostoma floridae]
MGKVWCGSCTLTLAAIVVLLGKPVGASDFDHHETLDVEGKFRIFWKFDDEKIEFEARVQTTGWVGLGLSPNGGMPGSDIAIGWVKDGIAHLTRTPETTWRGRCQVNSGGGQRSVLAPTADSSTVSPPQYCPLLLKVSTVFPSQFSPPSLKLCPPPLKVPTVLPPQFFPPPLKVPRSFRRSSLHHRSRSYGLPAAVLASGADSHTVSPAQFCPPPLKVTTQVQIWSSVQGGLDIKDELCLAGFQYYPKFNLTDCVSTPSLYTTSGFAGIQDADFDYDTLELNITAPAAMVGMTYEDAIKAVPWTEEKAQTFSDMLLNGIFHTRCLANPESAVDIVRILKPRKT